MKRVIVIGSPGSGKSTFSRRLAQISGLPLIHMDMLWHKSDRTTVTEEELDAKLREILKMDTWIIDGNYGRTMEMRMQACDTVVFLDLPAETCLKNALGRIGKARPDMPWTETEPDEEFLDVIRRFPAEQREKILELLRRYDDKTQAILKTREEAGRWLEEYGRRDRIWNRKTD